MRLSSEDLVRLKQKPGYGIASTTRKETRSECAVSHAEPEHHKAPALVRPISREEKGDRRVTVRFTGYRVRPLDPDNFAGSVKDLLDGLRHAGLIPGDEAWRIRLQTEQERVRRFADERTVIEIVSPAATSS